MDTNRVVAALKEKMGLPHGEVKPAAASSPAANAGASSRSTPSAQVAEAKDQIASVMSQQPADDGTKTVLEAKDQAINTLTERLSNMEASNSSLTEKLSQLLESMSQKPTPAAQPKVELPGLPSDLGERAPDEQLVLLGKAYGDLKASLEGTLQQRDQQLKQLLGPFAMELKEVSEMKDRQKVSRKYPKFDYEAHKTEMDALRNQLRGLTAVEAAELVAARTDPSILSVSDPVPHSDAYVPPPQAAASANQKEDTSRLQKELSGLIVDSHMKGRSAQANTLLDQLLGLKLGIRRAK